MLSAHNITVSSLRDLVILSLRIVFACLLSTLFLSLTIAGFNKLVYPNQADEQEQQAKTDVVRNGKIIGRALLKEVKASGGQWPQTVDYQTIQPYLADDVSYTGSNLSLTGFTYEKPTTPNLTNTRWWIEVGRVETKFGPVRITANGKASF